MTCQRRKFRYKTNNMIIKSNVSVPVRGVSKSSQGHARALELKYLRGERT